MDKRSFYSERLVEVRKVKGWSAAELVRRCGFPSQSTVSRLEDGTRVNPGATVLNRLCEALEISPDYLLGQRPELSEFESRTATAILTLETYLRREHLPEDTERLLRIVAERHTSPPVSVEDWDRLRESLSIVLRVIPSGPFNGPLRAKQDPCMCADHVLPGVNIPQARNDLRTSVRAPSRVTAVCRCPRSQPPAHQFHALRSSDCYTLRYTTTLGRPLSLPTFE
jgi:transcriptional regulator with XRE-family HTH domain